ncbi:MULTISPECIES: hypothetical protein [unclassified Nocardioides]|uniref:hypothetical protein n=1 Tax=unclassified Nocardioides TaxID=2615069 RepID=UPI0012F73520|nr:MULTISPECIES: hypothetical protein [unclassified Nocardioides]
MAEVEVDGADDGEGAVAGRDREAFPDGMDHPRAAVEDAGERDSFDEGAAVEAFDDDVGDALVDGVEQRLKGADLTWVEDGVAVDALEAADGIGAFGGGESALAQVASDVAELLLDEGVNRPGFRGGSVTWNQPRSGRVFQRSR